MRVKKEGRLGWGESFERRCGDQFTRVVAPEEGGENGGGLTEGSLDSIQEKNEKAARRAKARRRKSATKVPREVRNLEKAAAWCRSAEERELLRKQTRQARRLHQERVRRRPPLKSFASTVLLLKTGPDGKKR